VAAAEVPARAGLFAADAPVLVAPPADVRAGAFAVDVLVLVALAVDARVGAFAGGVSVLDAFASDVPVRAGSLTASAAGCPAVRVALAADVRVRVVVLV
jgi:hypothetical protein